MIVIRTENRNIPAATANGHCVSRTVSALNANLRFLTPVDTWLGAPLVTQKRRFRWFGARLDFLMKRCQVLIVLLDALRWFRIKKPRDVYGLEERRRL